MRGVITQQRDVCKAVVTDPIKMIIRYFDVAVKNGKALLCSQADFIIYLPLQLQCSDITNRIILFKITVIAIAVAFYQQNIASCSFAFRKTVAYDKSCFLTWINKDFGVNGKFQRFWKLCKIVFVHIIQLLVI